MWKAYMLCFVLLCPFWQSLLFRDDPHMFAFKCTDVLSFFTGESFWTSKTGNFDFTSTCDDKICIFTRQTVKGGGAAGHFSGESSQFLRVF